MGIATDASCRDLWSRGFGGRYASLSELAERCAPNPATICVLPRDAVRDGPFLRVPGGPFELIRVEALVEGFGDLQGFLNAVAGALAPGGCVLIDAPNEQSTHHLRRVLEGAGASLEPFGSARDIERPAMAGRILRCVRRSGLLPVDVCSVPSSASFDSAGFVQSAFQHGLHPIGYARGKPPARVWVAARRLDDVVVHGTVLIGSGSPEDVARTRASVEAALSTFDAERADAAIDSQAWEIVECSATQAEPEAFDRGVVKSCGDVLWLLRAGATVSPSSLVDLSVHGLRGPAAPASVEGDVSGLLIARHDMLCVGPLSVSTERFRSLSVAYENWALGLDVVAHGVQRVEVHGFLTPPVQNPGLDADSVRKDVEQLVEDWKVLDESREQSSGTIAANPPVDPVVPAPWAGREPTLALCMIARNEERFIGECIDAASPICDEIVVLDTGSTDRTAEIAESKGARVYHAEWRDDFAWARNECERHATADWILTLDADEVLTSDARDKIRDGIRRPDVGGYHLIVRNVYGDRPDLSVMILRLHRRLDGVAWDKKIHEQVSPSLIAECRDLGLSVGMLDATIDHHGYTDEIITSRNKNERNERIFRDQLADDPGDIYTRYKFGDFLRRVPGRAAESIDHLKGAFEGTLLRYPGPNNDVPFASEVAALIASEIAGRGEIDEAWDVLTTALRRFVPTPNLHYVAANTARKLGLYDAALDHYRVCLSYHGKTLVVPVQPGVTGLIAFRGIAGTWLAKGQEGIGERLLRLVRWAEPSDVQTTIALSRLHTRRGDIGLGLGVLTSYLRHSPADSSVCEEAAVLLMQIGRLNDARRFGQQAVLLLRKAGRQDEANDLEARVAGYSSAALPDLVAAGAGPPNEISSPSSLSRMNP